MIVSRNHEVLTVNQQKSASNPSDDKRILIHNKTDTLSWGFLGWFSFFLFYWFCFLLIDWELKMDGVSEVSKRKRENTYHKLLIYFLFVLRIQFQIPTTITTRIGGTTFSWILIDSEIWRGQRRRRQRRSIAKEEYTLKHSSEANTQTAQEDASSSCRIPWNMYAMCKSQKT